MNHISTMKTKTHRLCTFLFHNNTSINVVVPAFDADMRDRPFEDMLADAKRIGWNGDENHGRGGIQAFAVGERRALRWRAAEHRIQMKREPAIRSSTLFSKILWD